MRLTFKVTLNEEGEKLAEELFILFRGEACRLLEVRRGVTENQVLRIAICCRNEAILLASVLHQTGQGMPSQERLAIAVPESAQAIVNQVLGPLAVV